jgi:hypothetical protein
MSKEDMKTYQEEYHAELEDDMKDLEKGCLAVGMDLVNRHDNRIQFRHMEWARILYLAKDHGWQPAGTLSSYDHDDPSSEFYCPEPWDGGYSTNDGQMVTSNDARAFADALEKACERIPDERIESEKYVQVEDLPAFIDDPVVDLVVRTGSVDSVPREFLNVYEFFSGDGKTAIKELIAFCRQGEFYLF